ncbi:MAG: SUMF1/EgtB/PvdO family nonheme iron enzyme [Alistipes sp.]|nr:SUMF1/EgtB/PvdO family nonheme iron enzyme [Alistipes sp.]
MRRALIIALAALVSLFTMPAVAQEAKRLINIDQSSFRPVQTGALSGVGIDPIAIDRSKRPCARIKMHVNRMTREEIDGLTVRPIGGMVELTKKSTSVEGNGLIFELTAKEQVRFYLHHDIYGDSNEVTVNLEANKEYYLDAQLDQLFTITVASNMKDADVFIDNRYCNKTNEEYILIVHDITPGEHALRIEHAGRKAEQKILVHRDNVYFRCNVDTAEASPQYVVFEVEPANAMVFIDNEPQTTQEGFVQTVLQNGTYSWRVMAKGYHEQSGTFTVSGAKVTRKVTLKADAAMVTISAGGGADIWVNNERKGNSSWRGMLSSGTYIFEARKEGHRTTRLSQTITSATAEQSYTLDAPTPIMGRLDVSCVPAIADLYVDGKKIGETPLTTSLLVGEHSVELRRSGYTSQSQKVSVSEGKTATVNVTLAKVATTASTAFTAATYADSATANFDGFEMVFVKGGTFTMGATPEQSSDAGDDEKPAHSVTVSNFYIGKYEVTQAQWEAVMGKNPSRYKGDNRPVENVSWKDVQKFIKKLNAKTGKRYRLPTEAEWEYAARGSNQSKGYKYSGSNDIGSVAWYTDNSSSQTHPVGQKQPNELGLYDMSGNVYEWCSDWYGGYSRGSQTNPTGPANGSNRVLRGGYWGDGSMGCRVSYRNYGGPSGRGHDCGFRLVCQP